MKDYFVYIVKCSDQSYYTGITNNLEKRIHEHNFGFDLKSYTYSRRPVELVFAQSFPDPITAIEKEKQIKGWSRKKKETLIQGDFDKIIHFSNLKKRSSKSSD